MRLREWTFTIDDSEVEHKVTDILLYSDDDEKIELEFKPVFMPENGEMSWEDWNCFDSIRVYKTDYEKLLLSSIQSVFPVVDPDPNGWGLQEELDLTSPNFLGKEDWNKTIDLLINAVKRPLIKRKGFMIYSLSTLEAFRKSVTISA